jgi:hypothetical protein
MPKIAANDYGADVLADWAKLGLKLAEAQKKAVDQADELAGLQAVGNFDAALTESQMIIDQEVPVNGEADIVERQKRMMEKVKEHSEYFGTQLKGVGQLTFQKHLATHAPKEIMKFNAQSVTRLNEANLANLDKLGEELAKKAGYANSEKEYAEAVTKYTAALAGARESGTVGPIEQEKRRQQFNKAVNVNYLERQLITIDGRQNLRAIWNDPRFHNVDITVRLGYLDKAKKMDEELATNADRVTAEIKTATIDSWYAAANYNMLDEQQMAQALAGNHPYVTAKEAGAIRDYSEKQLTSKKLPALDIVMDNYEAAGGKTSVPAIRNAQKELRRLQQEQPERNTNITKALRTVNSDLHEKLRIDNSEQAAERATRNDAAKNAVDAFQARLRPIGIVDIGGEPKRRAQAGFRIRDRIINNGEDPETVVEDEYQKLYKWRDDLKKSQQQTPSVTLPSTSGQLTDQQKSEAIKNATRRR